MGLPAHKTRFWIFRFKVRCLQIFSLKQQVSMVTNVKIMMSSVLQIMKNLVFKSSVLIIPQIMLIFSLQENTRGAPIFNQGVNSLIQSNNQPSTIKLALNWWKLISWQTAKTTPHSYSFIDIDKQFLNLQQRTEI